MVTEKEALRPAFTRQRLGADLSRFCRQFYGRGWMPATSGNLSVRLPGESGHALITASGRDKGDLTAADTVLVDARTGAPAEESRLRPSAETCIHAAVYRATDAGAVVHVHSPYATAVACRVGAAGGTGTLELADHELLKALACPTPPAPPCRSSPTTPRCRGSQPSWRRTCGPASLPPAPSGHPAC